MTNPPPAERRPAQPIRFPSQPVGRRQCATEPTPEPVRHPAAAAPEAPAEEAPPEEKAPTGEGVPAEFKSALRKADLHDQPTSEYGA